MEITSPPPRATRAGRLAEYVNVMFQPALLAPAAVANFLGVDLTLRALAGQTPLQLTWRSALGAATVFLFSLLMRVQDELKDVEADLRLGKAGDPRYKDRPIVTGRVLVEDLVFLRWATVAALVLVNAPLGPLPLAAFAFAYLLVWLSFKWFFWPAIKKSLLLAFATHNPITLAVELHAVSVTASQIGIDKIDTWTVPLLFGLFFPVSAWETSRKIRTPAEETEYETYSKALGWKVAPFLPAFFIAASCTLLVLVGRQADVSPIFLGLLVTLAALGVGAALLFRFAPTPARANLKPWAEAYTVVANVGLVVALIARHGAAL